MTTEDFFTIRKGQNGHTNAKGPMPEGEAFADATAGPGEVVIVKRFAVVRPVCAATLADGTMRVVMPDGSQITLNAPTPSITSRGEENQN
jgi:hypothetical protein